jgi:hypothetical protein
MFAWSFAAHGGEGFRDFDAQRAGSIWLCFVKGQSSTMHRDTSTSVAGPFELALFCKKTGTRRPRPREAAELINLAHVSWIHASRLERLA